MKIFWRFLKSFIILFCLNIKTQATEISPYIGFGNDIFSFSIDELGQEAPPINYEPNIPGLTRLGLSAWGLGASVTFRGDVKELDPAKGSSRFIDYQLNYHNNRWGIDSYAQSYDGFFVKNSSQIGKTDGSYFLYPDLHFAHYGLMARYALSDSKFSIAGLLNQSDEVSQTAGSYFLVGGIQQYRLSSDQTFIPTSMQNKNSDMDNLRELKSTTVNLGLGAGKYWVSENKFFIGLVFDLLGTYGIYNYKLTTQSMQSSYSTLSYNIKAGFGYSGENWKSGISLYNDVTTLRGLNNSLIKPSAISLMAYFRYVFKD